MARMDRQESVAGLAGPLLAIAVAGLLVPVRDDIGNTNVALVLVLVVVGAAALGGRMAGALTAVAATLAFNFFHTQPLYSLHVDASEDIWTVVLLLVVGLGVGELAVLGQVRTRKLERERAGLDRLQTVSALVAAGEPTSEVWPAVRTALVDELHLESARYEPLRYRAVRPARPTLERRGTFETPAMHWTREGMELPRVGVELEVRTGKGLLGHLVLDPSPGRGTSPGERRVAVALADQLAIAIERDGTDSILE